MEQHIRQALLDAAPQLFGCNITEDLIQFQQTRKDVEGDLTLVVFPFVKLLRCSPQEAGGKLKNWIEANVVGVSQTPTGSNSLAKCKSSHISVLPKKTQGQP